jgi:hypothetical protein
VQTDVKNTNDGPQAKLCAQGGSMTTFQGPRRSLFAAVLVALSACAPLLAAPDDTEPAAGAEGVQQQRQVFIDEANLDQWIFQGQGNADNARRQLQSRLKLQIDDADRVCQLSSAQKEKLALAAEGDIKLFFEEVSQVREKFRAVQTDPNAFNQIWQEIQPLQQRMAKGLFGETSFFAKTLRKILSREQLENYRAKDNERRMYRYRASIEAALAKLESSVPLTDEQSEKLTRLLLENSSPPQTFGQYDYYVVVHQLSKLPEDRLKPLFSDRQWELLDHQFGQYRNLVGVLIQNGALPKEVAEEPADAPKEE